MLTLLELLTGLALFYLLVAIAASYVVECIASYLNLRARGLERFIAQSFGEGTAIEQAPWAKAFYAHPVINSLFTPTALTRGTESAPSYIPAASFSSTLLDLLRAKLKQPAGEALRTDELRKLLDGNALPTGIASILTTTLSRGISETQAIQSELEHWFDASMQRASGWYKRYTQIWLFGIALALAAAFNLDSFYLAKRLMQDPELMSSVANSARNVNPGDGSKTLDDTRHDLRLILAENRGIQHIASLVEKPASDLEARKAVLDLVAANHLDPVTGGQARAILDKASQSPPADLVAAFKALPKEGDKSTPCLTADTSGQKSPIDDSTDSTTWKFLLTCEIEAAGKDADKLAAAGTHIESFFKSIAASPARTIDPQLGELGRTYLLSPETHRQESLSKLQTYLKARLQSADALRDQLNKLHQKLPDIGWICDVATHWGVANWFAAIFGWLTTALMASLGAPFWFELIGRLVNLRGVGTKPTISGANHAGK